MKAKLIFGGDSDRIFVLPVRSVSHLGFSLLRLPCQNIRFYIRGAKHAVIIEDRKIIPVIYKSRSVGIDTDKEYQN